MSASLGRRDLFAINLSNIALLVTGFASTLLVPRLAIRAMGVEEYGLFALLLGYCLIPTIMDLGIMPGLTRELGALLSEGKLGQANRLLSRIRGWLGAGAFVVAGGVAFVAGLSSKSGMGILWPVFLGASANAAMLTADMTILKLRVSSRIVQANLMKCLYYCTYIGSVAAFALTHRLGLTALLGSQFIGAVAYSIVVVLSTRAVWIGHKGDPVPVAIPWKRLMRAALPDQMNRAQNALLPGAERSLMFSLAGGTFVGAYDVALRMSALVTSAPAALSDPLIALLSSRQHEERRAERAMIMKHSVQLSLATLLCALAATFLFVKYFAFSYYHMAGTAFLPITGFVVLGSAVNVLTAPAVAHFYSIGRPGPVIAKTAGDISFALVALGLGSWSRNPLIYVAVRYCGYLFTATGLLAFSLWAFRRATRLQILNQ
jgi:O-antigen/teichoic acid export membrane protein